MSNAIRASIMGRHVPRRGKQNLFDWLLDLLSTPVSLSGRGFGGVRELIFRAGAIDPANVSAPLPTRRYLAELRYAAQHPRRYSR